MERTKRGTRSKEGGEHNVTHTGGKGTHQRERSRLVVVAGFGEDEGDGGPMRFGRGDGKHHVEREDMYLTAMELQTEDDGRWRNTVKKSLQWLWLLRRDEGENFLGIGRGE